MHSFSQPVTTEGPLILLAASCSLWNFPNKGSNLCPLQWKYRVLTKGPPGKPEGPLLRKDWQVPLCGRRLFHACVCVYVCCACVIEGLWVIIESLLSHLKGSPRFPSPQPSTLGAGGHKLSSLSLSWGMLVHGGGWQGAWLTSLSHPAYKTSLLTGWWPKIRWVKIKVVFQAVSLWGIWGTRKAARFVIFHACQLLTSHIRSIPENSGIEGASQWAVHWRYFPTTVIASVDPGQPHHQLQCAYSALQFTKRHF